MIILFYIYNVKTKRDEKRYSFCNQSVIIFHCIRGSNDRISWRKMQILNPFKDFIIIPTIAIVTPFLLGTIIISIIIYLQWKKERAQYVWMEKYTPGWKINIRHQSDACFSTWRRATKCRVTVWNRRLLRHVPWIFGHLDLEKPSVIHQHKKSQVAKCVT